MVFDEREEMMRIEKEKREGKNELDGCFFLNRPSKIIGICQDNYRELLYLVSY